MSVRQRRWPDPPSEYLEETTQVRVRFQDYILASFGMLPATVLYVYSGRVIGDVAALAGGAPPHE